MKKKNVLGFSWLKFKQKSVISLLVIKDLQVYTADTITTVSKRKSYSSTLY
jgi:hypothetical protein